MIEPTSIYPVGSLVSVYVQTSRLYSGGDSSLTYRVPEKLINQVFCFQRVIVPYGDEKPWGIIVGLEPNQDSFDKFSQDKIKDIIRIIDKLPILMMINMS